MKSLNKYRFEVSTEDESGETEYVIRYVDVPNISGSGSTLEEAVQEAEENLSFYLDYLRDKGKEIPLPTEPLTFPDLSGKITLRMSQTLHAKIIERSAYEKVSINTLVVEALSSYISQQTVSDYCIKTMENFMFDLFPMIYSNANPAFKNMPKNLEHKWGLSDPDA